jgi:hypothetical protein
MKDQIKLPQTVWLSMLLAALSPLIATTVFAAGIPEPGLVMYGTVRNTAAGNARLITGTLTWTITPASGSPVTVTTPLTDISGQYSYALRVPFESVVGSSTLSPNTLPLNSATTSYVRTNVYLTVNGTNYPATIFAPALGNFTFNTATRGRMDPVDLTVNAPGVTGNIVGAPSFASAPRFSNGKFELSANGTIGQSYTMLASTDLVNWTTVTVFVCTNLSTVVCDPAATNYPKRFYRLSQ